MQAPMLARTPRRGHVHCECHDHRNGGNPGSRRSRRDLRRTHKRRMRAADTRAERAHIRAELD